VIVNWLNETVKGQGGKIEFVRNKVLVSEVGIGALGFKEVAQIGTLDARRIHIEGMNNG
jgi:hypothetical protein